MRSLLLVTLLGCGFNGRATPDATGAITGDATIAYSKTITIHPTGLGSELADFPVVIALPGDPGILAHALPGGGDLVFLVDGEVVPHELESFELADGALVAWVRVPVLHAMAPTVVTLGYGSGVEATPSPAAVWAGFAGVYHFAATAVGVSADSTTQHDGTMMNAPMPGVAGQIGPAIRFPKLGSSYVTMGNAFDFSGTQPWTLSFWTRAESLNPTRKFARIIAKTQYANGNVHGFSIEHGNNHEATVYRTVTSTAVYTQDAAPVPLAYTFFTASYDGAMLRLSVNDLPRPSVADVRPMSPIDAEFKVAADIYDSGVGDPYYGDLDELRISNVARTRDWMTAEYTNQRDPMAFYDVGPEVAH